MIRTTRTFILCFAFLSATFLAARAQDLPVEQTLQVVVGKSIVVKSPETLKRVSVTDNAIASTMIVSPHEVLIHGQTPGTVSLMLWDEQEHSLSYNLHVDVDLTNLRQTVQDVFPGENI